MRLAEFAARTTLADELHDAIASALVRSELPRIEARLASGYRAQRLSMVEAHRLRRELLHRYTVLDQLDLIAEDVRRKL